MRAIYTESVQGLYPIIDLEVCERFALDPIDAARSVLVARPPLLQLRAKMSAPREVLAILRGLRPMTSAAGTLLFANDRPDLALMAGADGVHLGQRDLPLEEVRRFAPELRLGISTHNLEELELALDARPFYVAFGPVFPTATKANPEPTVGLDALAVAALAARAVGVPLVAIGGIRRANLESLRDKADVISVISDLMAPEPKQIEARTLELARLIAR